MLAPLPTRGLLQYLRGLNEQLDNNISILIPFMEPFLMFARRPSLMNVKEMKKKHHQHALHKCTRPRFSSRYQLCSFSHDKILTNPL